MGQVGAFRPASPVASRVWERSQLLPGSRDGGRRRWQKAQKPQETAAPARTWADRGSPLGEGAAGRRRAGCCAALTRVRLLLAWAVLGPLPLRHPFPQSWAMSPSRVFDDFLFSLWVPAVDILEHFLSRYEVNVPRVGHLACFHSPCPQQAPTHRVGTQTPLGSLQ